MENITDTPEKLTIKQQFGMNLATLMVKRIMSDSPLFAKAIRALAAKWAGVAFILGALFQYKLLPLTDSQNQLGLNIVEWIGIGLGGVVATTYLDTTDPALKSPDTKNAIMHAGS